MNGSSHHQRGTGLTVWTELKELADVAVRPMPPGPLYSGRQGKVRLAQQL